MCLGLHIAAFVLLEAIEQELEDNTGNIVHLFRVWSHGRECGDGSGEDDKK